MIGVRVQLRYRKTTYRCRTRTIQSEYGIHPRPLYKYRQVPHPVSLPTKCQPRTFYTPIIISLLDMLSISIFVLILALIILISTCLSRYDTTCPPYTISKQANKSSPKKTVIDYTNPMSIRLHP